MKKLKKLSIFFVIVVFCMFSLSGCYSAEGIETLAYVVAIGIDKGENNKINLSLQIAILNDSSNEGSSQSKNTTLAMVECSSIDSGIGLINSYLSKKINLSHCKSIIISEELAYEGISEYIFTITNNLEIRPDCNIIISRCKASDYLDNSDPTLESISARYYEFTVNSSKYTGYTEDVELDNFYSDLLSTTCQAHAILGGVNVKSTHPSNNNEPYYDKDGSYKADETPIKSETVIETMGIAVFNGDKLVGELDGIETLCHMLLVDELENATISIPNPFNLNSVISLYISTTKKPKISIKFINGTPFVDCKISISANILSLDEDLDYSDADNLKIISDYADSFLEENISSYLYKTSKLYKSDIANIGRFASKNYITWQDWIDSDWLNNYENAFFNVSIDSTIETGQLFTKI